MNELSDLYQQLILDHNARPHNFGEMPDATHQADGYNPLCGDQVTVFVKLDEASRISAVRFSGKGCAISKASASLMTDFLRGKSLDETNAAFEQFRALVSGKEDADASVLGKLAALAGVREFPMRVKCATLAWHTLRAALQKEAGAPVTTE